MPRLARIDLGEHIYHVINRSVGRLTIFESKEDYQLFEELLVSAKEEVGMHILAYVLMPNHWHLVLYPQKSGDLGTFMHRLTNAHTRHVHTKTGTVGQGPLYQGRYKSFLVQDDPYFFTLMKYVERNPVRAKLANICEEWRWGSAWRRVNGTDGQRKLLDTSPISLPQNYQKWIDTPEKEDDLKRLRTSVNKGAPYGRSSWVETMIKKHGLETTVRSAGRPKKS